MKFISLVLLGFFYLWAQTGAELTVTLNDFSTKEPIAWAEVHLIELHRTAVSDFQGRFTIKNLPGGTYTLDIHRVGYHHKTFTFSIGSNEKKAIVYAIETSDFEYEVVDVKGGHFSQDKHESFKNLMDESKLRRNSGTTIAETMKLEPGVAMVSMGSASAKPVLRGMTGNRLEILEDGKRASDASNSAPDHALTIRPENASQIEILRGPKSLLYSSNAIGGVINIVKNLTPATLPSEFTGSTVVSTGRINNQYGIDSEISLPFQNSVLNLNGNYLKTSNTQSADAEIHNSSIESYAVSGGYSQVQNWGFFGLSGAYFDSNYGVPGEEEGAQIHMKKAQYEARTEIHTGNKRFERFDMHLSYTDYFQEELGEHHDEEEHHEEHGEEEEEEHEGFTIDQKTIGLKGKVHHHLFSQKNEGVFGFSFETQNFKPNGEEVSTPHASHQSFAGFLTQEYLLNNIQLESGIRYDYKTVSPEGAFKNRTYSGLSVSGSARYPFTESFVAELSYIRTFRPPSTEELYMNGNHLAAQSFDIGNENLSAEHGNGIELGLSWNSDWLNSKVSIYQNSFADYIYLQKTNGIENNLPVYQYMQHDAVFLGGEFMLEAQFNTSISADISLSHVEAKLTDRDVYLPLIPPFTFKSHVHYNVKNTMLELGAVHHMRQENVGEFESKTGANTVYHFTGEYNLPTKRFMQSFILKVENIFNETYRNHLSRLKETFPESGRNFKLLYKLYF